MSASQYRAAMDNAWAVATNRANSLDYMERQVAMWVMIADAELREPVKGSKRDSFSWAPPSEGDPSVVGDRCTECRHFVDNHTDENGCRECGCEWISRVA